MRTLSDTLLKAQQAGPTKALVKLVLTHNSTTYTYTETQILSIKETGDGSLQTIAITLDNSDKSLTALDLRGYEGVLSFGAITAARKEYSDLAPMTVRAQEFDSDPKKLECTLTLIGICNDMAEDEASEAYQPDEDDVKSVKTLVDEIITATIACFNHCTAYEVEWDAGYDDLADTYIPKDAFRIYVGNNRNSAIDRLLEYTKNVKVVKNDGKIHIFKPTTSGTTYDSEYSLASGHPFFSKALRNRLVTPNYVKVQSRDDDDPQYSGTATDAVSFALLPKAHFKKTYLSSNAQGTAIAEAILAQAIMWCEAGAASVPLNCGTEAFDYVKVTDQREGDYRVGNIGRYTRYYDVRKNEWRMAFNFGNWQNARKALANLNIKADDLENYFSRLQVGDLYVENLLAKNMGFYWIDPEGNIDLDKIGDNLDNLPDGEQYARVSTWNLKLDEDPESPTYGLFVLNMDEHTIYQPGYDPNEKRRTFTATPTTPYDVGDLWLDADTVKRCTTARASGAYVAGDWTATTLDAIANGEIFSRVKTASLSAEGLVLLDQTVEGTYGLTKKASLSAEGLVLLDQVVEGTYGRILQTDITSHHVKGTAIMQSSTARLVTDGEKGYWNEAYGIALDAYELSVDVKDDLEDLNDGIVAGYLTLSEYTEIEGEWYLTGGVLMHASKGIRIFGTNKAFSTYATEADARAGTNAQCYVGSDGKIRAGGGNVIMGNDSLILKGNITKLQTTGGSDRGVMYADSDEFGLSSAPGIKLALQATNSSVWMLADKGMVIPRLSSSPSGAFNGTMYYNTTDHLTYIRSNGVWQTFDY